MTTLYHILYLSHISSKIFNFSACQNLQSLPLVLKCITVIYYGNYFFIKNQSIRVVFQNYILLIILYFPYIYVSYTNPTVFFYFFNGNTIFRTFSLEKCINREPFYQGSLYRDTIFLSNDIYHLFCSGIDVKYKS